MTGSPTTRTASRARPLSKGAAALLVGLALTAATPALAQTSAQSGPWMDLTPGLGLGGSPFAATFGARFSLGVWRGNYDHGFLLGRSWGVGVAGRVDLFGSETRFAPSLEIRRTVDLLVIGYRWRVLVGPEWQGANVGVGARLGGTLKVRPSRYIGPTIDVEAGAAYVDGTVSPRLAIGLGVEGSLSWSGREQRDPAHSGSGGAADE